MSSPPKRMDVLEAILDNELGRTVKVEELDTLLAVIIVRSSRSTPVPVCRLRILPALVAGQETLTSAALDA